MCTASNHRYVVSSATLIAVATAATLATTGCGMFSDEDDPGEQDSGEIHEEDHTFRSFHLPEVSTIYPVAVGAKADIEVLGVTEIEDVEVEDSDIFAVDDIDGDKFTVRALKSGETSFQVFVDEENDDLSTDTFKLRANEAVSATLEPTCSLLDLAEPMLDIAYDGERVWPTDEIVSAKLILEVDQEEYVHGYGYHPFSVEPAEDLAFGAPSILAYPHMGPTLATKSGVELITGPNAGEVVIDPTIDGPQLSMPLVHGEEIDDITIVRLEGSDTDDAYFSHTLPGEEPTLDLVENETYTILPHRFAQDRIACEPNYAQHVDESDLSYRLTTKTPDICKVERITTSAEPSESVELRSSTLAGLRLKDAGQCTVEVEYLRRPEGDELIDEFNWVVE